MRLLAVLALLVVAAPGSASPQAPLVVRGNHLTVVLHGVNRSSFEYACVQWGAAYEGPVDAKAIAAMTAWHINAVRIPLNSSCWLARASYRAAVLGYVSRLHAAGLYVILDLHWDHKGQAKLADPQLAPRFWSSVATTLRSDRRVLFDLYNEPHDVTWPQWRASMQQLVDAVRRTGSSTPLMLGGLAWSNDLSGWLRWMPRDPKHQLVASFHLYNFNTCADPGCWDRTVAPVAAKVPVVTGELGENDCAHGFIDTYMPWADAHAISYLGWTWNTWNCSQGPALISSWDGTPTPFGAGFRAHLLALG